MVKMAMKSAATTNDSPIAPVHEKYFVWMVLLVTAITYVGTIRFDFVYDDFPQIVYNPFLRAGISCPSFL